MGEDNGRAVCTRTSTSPPMPSIRQNEVDRGRCDYWHIGTERAECEPELTVHECQNRRVIQRMPATAITATVP